MRKWLALGVQVPFVAMMWVACNGDSGTQTDASDDVTVKDSGKDAKTLPDVAVQDTGGGCMPSATIDTTMIHWIPPVAPNPTACTDVQVQAYWTACFSTTASTAACQAFNTATANLTCYGCMLTSSTASAYGALIGFSGVDYANIAGCIAIETGDNSSTGCGAKNQAVLQCETLACASNCAPVTDQTTFQAYTACTSAADQAVCATYINAECNLADAGIDGAAAAASTCENQASFQAYFNAMAGVFCGDYTSDGGSISDASADAPDGD